MRVADSHNLSFRVINTITAMCRRLHQYRKVARVTTWNRLGLNTPTEIKSSHRYQPLLAAIGDTKTL